MSTSNAHKPNALSKGSNFPNSDNAYESSYSPTQYRSVRGCCASGFGPAGLPLDVGAIIEKGGVVCEAENFANAFARLLRSVARLASMPPVRDWSERTE
jgi:hypothetical protein